MATTATKTRRKKTKRNLQKGVLHIQATFNNTIVSITDEAGNVVAWKSSGAVGFKGSRKSTPYASQIATEKVLEKAKEFGVNKIEVVVKGIGSGRDSAIRALMASGIETSAIRDVTGMPHNGCRPRKARRV